MQLTDAFWNLYLKKYEQWLPKTMFKSMQTVTSHHLKSKPCSNKQYLPHHNQISLSEITDHYKSFGIYDFEVEVTDNGTKLLSQLVALNI